MSRNKGIGKFVFGAAIGAGLGLLFAPKKGSELRADLKEKLDDLVKQIKNIDKEEIKAQFDEKVEQIKEELRDLDKEKALNIAKTKASELRDKAQELVELAIDKGTPILRDAAEDVKERVISVTKDVIKKLEKKEK